MLEVSQGRVAWGWGVGLVEKLWPAVLESWVFTSSLPLTCCVTLGKILPLPGPRSHHQTMRSLE